eukprot:GFYU01002694.1.p1 GENE.GFYU01002694.1~~GFYU01002694.1.p1  ORF type:complete len:287 (+),score=65.48 GFYU01002694.1:110-970(+)
MAEPVSSKPHHAYQPRSGKRSKKYSEAKPRNEGRKVSKRDQRRMNNLIFSPDTPPHLRHLHVGPDGEQFELEARNIEVAYRSPFGDLFVNPGNITWDPFREITEEEQVRRLKFLKRRGKLSRGSQDSFSDCESVEDLLKHMDKTDRRLLKKCMVYDREFLVYLEQRIVQFVGNDDSAAELTVECKDSLYRIIAHAMCRFYSLVSYSENLHNGIRVTKIRKPMGYQPPVVTNTGSPASVVSLVETLDSQVEYPENGHSFSLDTDDLDDSFVFVNMDDVSALSTSCHL